MLSSQVRNGDQKYDGNHPNNKWNNEKKEQKFKHWECSIGTALWDR